MPIPTEPIGSIPRPQRLIEAAQDLAIGRLAADAYARLLDEVVRETIEQFEATGSPVISDGEQGKPSFATYPVHGLETPPPPASPGTPPTSRGRDSWPLTGL